MHSRGSLCRNYAGMSMQFLVVGASTSSLEETRMVFIAIDKAHLTSHTGIQWALRKLISPAFTSASNKHISDSTPLTFSSCGYAPGACVLVQCASFLCSFSSWVTRSFGLTIWTKTLFVQIVSPKLRVTQELKLQRNEAHCTSTHAPGA